ncbi:MAG: hypothetical protein KAW12_11910 [Candidatus Aminicenantes bacterium]|nr:hypothetical protein [Candidatus Aminicenantes bacterium]
MPDLNETFGVYKNSSRVENLSLSEDFEAKVFAKIKKKKTVRRNIAAAIAGFSLAGFLFLAHSMFFDKNPAANKQFIAQQESTQQEEIPLMEDVIFASSDSQTNYAIEQVAYYQDDDTI